MFSLQPRDAGPDRADPADHHVDRHPGLGGPVQRVDQHLVDDRVHLEPDHRRRPSRWLRDLPLDPVDQAAAQRARRDQQPPVGGLRGVPGELVEQPAQVLADLRVAGEHAEVLVQPGGLRVVVPGADVAVAAQPVGLLADHQAELGVRLQPDDAVDHVHPGLLQLAGPEDVRLLVEAGLDLDQGEHLLAGLGRVDQGVDDRGVAAGPVQGLLDRQHLAGRPRPAPGRPARWWRTSRTGGAAGCRARGIAPNMLLGLARLHLVQVPVGLRPGTSGSAARAGPGRRSGSGRAGRAARAARRPRTRVTPSSRISSLAHVRVDVVGDLEPDRGAEPAAQQLLLQRLEQVLRVVLLDLQVLVAGDPEGVVLPAPPSPGRAGRGGPR